MPSYDLMVPHFQQTGDAVAPVYRLVFAMGDGWVGVGIVIAQFSGHHLKISIIAIAAGKR